MKWMALIHTWGTIFQTTSTGQLSMAQAVLQVRICFIRCHDFLTQPLQGPASRGTNQAVMRKPITTNNFVTKLYQYATAFQRNHFQLTRPNG